MKKLFYLLIPLFFLSYFSTSKTKAQDLPHPDSVEMLITSMAMQIEATQGLNDMYNFDFRSAESQFQWMKRRYPEHPLGYFLMGLSNFWKMMPNEDVTTYDATFNKYMDSTIMYAEKIFDKAEKKSPKQIEAAFFLSAAYAFKGRLESNRRNWTSATIAGKRALNYLEDARGYGDLSPELLFGDGLYNYYVEWIPENYGELKPILWFFKDGDKAKGIKQLEEVTAEGFYTKTEAQNFLVRIYNEESKTDPMYREKALNLAAYLHQSYPQNAYFHRQYLKLLYLTGDGTKTIEESKKALDLIEKGAFGYEATIGRYAAFFLGSHHFRALRKYDEAKKYLKQAVEFGESVDAQEAGYYLYSLAYLGQIAHIEKDYMAAKGYYEKIKDHADRKHPTKKEAKKYLRENRKLFK
ncbi:tetratricopeptide repeat protein [Bernardetia sp.]|uniref:tetratricopeptide repeat protein n=1 Tax=Bernardetia sp. TaxID=1937974 RepID=UPI0025BD8A52|nr:tol-pal system protein YbgF [Bernardetia sp.]